MRTLEVLQWTAIIVALITFLGTVLSALIPKLWERYVERKAPPEEGDGAGFS
jgi:hypothetical protein